jgi:hypothetical protein
MIPFAEYCEKVRQHIQLEYGVCVVVRDIPDPLTGDLDGVDIHIDYASTPEQSLFLLAHLFGHTVQWNLDPHNIHLGGPQRIPVPRPMIPALIAYEREAASYALCMLHSIGITAIDQWFSDYSACDVDYLHHYYSTGEKKDFMGFWVEATTPIHPKPIPPFTPVRHSLRTNGVVI